MPTLLCSLAAGAGAAGGGGGSGSGSGNGMEATGATGTCVPYCIVGILSAPNPGSGIPNNAGATPHPWPTTPQPTSPSVLPSPLTRTWTCSPGGLDVYVVSVALILVVVPACVPTLPAEGLVTAAIRLSSYPYPVPNRSWNPANAASPSPFPSPPAPPAARSSPGSPNHASPADDGQPVPSPRSWASASSQGASGCMNSAKGSIVEWRAGARRGGGGAGRADGEIRGKPHGHRTIRRRPQSKQRPFPLHSAAGRGEFINSFTLQEFTGDQAMRPSHPPRFT